MIQSAVPVCYLPDPGGEVVDRIISYFRFLEVVGLIIGQNKLLKERKDVGLDEEKCGDVYNNNNNFCSVGAVE